MACASKQNAQQLTGAEGELADGGDASRGGLGLAADQVGGVGLEVGDDHRAAGAAGRARLLAGVGGAHEPRVLHVVAGVHGRQRERAARQQLPLAQHRDHRHHAVDRGAARLRANLQSNTAPGNREDKRSAGRRPQHSRIQKVLTACSSSGFSITGMAALVTTLSAIGVPWSTAAAEQTSKAERSRRVSHNAAKWLIGDTRTDALVVDVAVNVHVGHVVLALAVGH